MTSHRTATKDTLWPSKEPGEKPFFIPAGSSYVHLQVYDQCRDLTGRSSMSRQCDLFRLLDASSHRYASFA